MATPDYSNKLGGRHPALPWPNMANGPSSGNRRLNGLQQSRLVLTDSPQQGSVPPFRPEALPLSLCDHQVALRGLDAGQAAIDFDYCCPAQPIQGFPIQTQGSQFRRFRRVAPAGQTGIGDGCPPVLCLGDSIVDLGQILCGHALSLQRLVQRVTRRGHSPSVMPDQVRVHAAPPILAVIAATSSSNDNGMKSTGMSNSNRGYSASVASRSSMTVAASLSDSKSSVLEMTAR